MSKPLILHAHKTGPNPFKVAIVLELLGLKYQVKLWEFGDNDTNGVKGKKFLALCENGRVPVLEDPNTGVTSWESGACINYLVRVYDKKGQLGPADNEQSRVDYDKWIFFLVSNIGPMMGQTNWFRHYHDKKNDDAQQRFDAQCHRTFAVLDEHLQRTDGGFILPGGKFTGVDAHCYPWVAQAKFAQLDMGSYKGIQKWLDKCGNMKEVKAAYEAIPNGEKL